MIDNLSIIKENLTFESEGDFYIVEILQRGKDFGKSQNRMIKTYYVYSIQYLDNHYDEIKKLCDVFNARAYISVNAKNDNEIGLPLITEISKTLQSKQTHKLKRLYKSVAVKSTSKNKRFIVDVDTLDIEYQKSVAEIINHCHDTKSIIKYTVPTRNGIHYVTIGFNVEKFKQLLSALNENYDDIPSVDVHKNNPTILYIPNIK